MTASADSASPSVHAAPAKSANPPTPSRRLAAKLGVGFLVFCTIKGLVYVALAAGGAAALWR